MQIDWLIVGAQVLNFLVLVWLLKRFLYRPVIEAMSRREQHIADRLGQAAEREQLAQQAQARLDAELEQIAARRDALLVQAREAAEAERHTLRERARADVEMTEARWRRDLQREQGEFFAELRREVATAAQAMASQWLQELADADLQQRMADHLLARLDRLDEASRAELAGSRDGVTLRTAWPLDEAARARLTERLRQRLGPALPVHWLQDETLLCGLALEGAGHRLAWDLADRMEGLEQRLQARLAALAADVEPAPAEPA
jgi:F-type H+-transporting ATPase subunit b